MKQKLKSIIFYVAFIALTVVIVIFVMNSLKGEAPKTSDLIAMFEKGEIASYEWDTYTDTLTVTNDKGLSYEFTAITEITYREQILPIVEETNKQVALLDTYKKTDDKYYDAEGNEVKVLRTSPITYDHKERRSIPIWVSFIPYAVLIIAVIAVFIFARRQSEGRDGARGFGRARAKLGSNEKEKVYFRDVAGCDEEKEELTEIVEFLRDPEKFTRLGAKIPHGVLLMGPPGTGKTLLAKAVAGEAGVPFYSISGSDFVEMYVGVGASRVRDLFETARKNPAAIIFIDEIDAVGRHRGAGLGGGHDEREQTLNQLLVEMDGFSASSGIIVMAATNRPDILDPALLRPGRFDRQVTVNYPTQKGREEILKVHARNKPLEKTVDLGKIAQLTIGFTGADLANVLNEAALAAARKGKSLIGMNDIEESVLKVMEGTTKKSMKMNEKDRRNTAYHEAGHAVVCYYMPALDPVTRITILPSSKGALGYTLIPPTEDKYSEYKEELKQQIAMIMGGRVAEEILHDGDYSGGASGDIRSATSIARKMVTRLGMSPLGPILYGSDHGSDEVFLGRDFSADKNYSDRTAAEIDDEVRKIITEGYEKARSVLEEHRAKWEFIAEYLIRYEEMDGAQFKRAMEEDVSPEEIYAMDEERRRISRLENEEKARIDEEERKKREADLMRDEQYRRGSVDVNAGGNGEPPAEDEAPGGNGETPPEDGTSGREGGSDDGQDGAPKDPGSNE